MPPVDGEVSESEIMSMFDKDGDLREEPQSVEDDSAEEGQDDESEQEEETDEDPEAEEGDDEEEEEESEESDEDDEEEESEAPELDWSKATPEHRAAYEQSQKEVLKLRKDYGKIQSKLHEVSQSRREETESLDQLRQSAEMANQWSQILEQHPELQDQIVALIQKVRNPDSDIPEEVKNDPAYKLMIQREQRLRSEIDEMKGKLKPVDDWQKQEKTREAKSKLDGLLDQANTKYKAMFKKDMTEVERKAVLEYMVKNKHYSNGGIAALEVFADQYEKALSAKNSSHLRDKAKKFGRTKTVNSGRVATEAKIGSSDDAIKQAFRDQGVEL